MIQIYYWRILLQNEYKARLSIYHQKFANNPFLSPYTPPPPPLYPFERYSLADMNSEWESDWSCLSSDSFELFKEYMSKWIEPAYKNTGVHICIIVHHDNGCTIYVDIMTGEKLSLI